MFSMIIYYKHLNQIIAIKSKVRTKALIQCVMRFDSESFDAIAKSVHFCIKF